MNKRTILSSTLTALLVFLSLYGMPFAAEEDNSPDAVTAATASWISGDWGGFEAGEGIMTIDEIKDSIAELLGGKKHFNVLVLGTSYNSLPVTTIAEFVLDNETMTVYGIHEKGTEKLIQIENNPNVCYTYEEGFGGFSDMRGVQMKGTCELIYGDDPDFEQILIDVIPYEKYQEMMGLPLDAIRTLLSTMMLITKTTLHEVTITNSDFKADGYRSYQRWTRGVKIASYTAKPGNAQVTLDWTTEGETDNVGFDIYRSVDGSDYTKITTEQIASKGAEGGTYQYVDSTAQNLKAHKYLLVNVDTDGRETMHGPVTTTPRLIYGIIPQ